MYLQKYLSGNEQAVWNEIESFQIEALSPHDLEEIEEVCRETMVRVKENINRIIARLEENGYDFSKFPDGEDHFFVRGLEDPDTDLEVKIVNLESIAGTLPLTVKAFWRYIGSVSLVGFKDVWDEYSDPLFVASVDDNTEVIEEWQKFRKECEEHSDDPYMLFISPDEDQKDGYDGDQYYNIELPCTSVDGFIRDAPSETTFIDYLREAFEAKGFPGLEEVPEFLKDLELLRI